MKAVTRKNVGNLGDKVVADTVELNWEVTREGWVGAKGGVEAVTGVDDNAAQPKERDEGGLDVVEGQWVS